MSLSEPWCDENVGLVGRIEEQRRAFMADLRISDGGLEPGLDALTQAAAALTECPIALVSLIDDDRLWFESHVGITSKQAPRERSFCAHAVETPELMQVRDAARDPRFSAHPMVTGAPNIRFYAGQPLRVDGIAIGSLCVVDTQPRVLAPSQLEALRCLGAAAAAMLGERRHRATSLTQRRRLTDFAMVAGDWLWETDADHRLTWMSGAYATDPAAPAPWELGQPMTDGAVLDAAGEPLQPATTLHRLLGQERAFTRAVVRSDAPGAPSYMSHSAVSRYGAHGQWCGYRGSARDMRAQIEAEQARRNAASVLAELSVQVPGLIFQFRLDANGHMSFPYVSEHIRDVYELDAADVESDAAPAIARWHPDDAGWLMASFRRSAAGLALWQERFRVVLPRRGERLLSGSANPRRLADGSVLWHGLLTDVTEQALEADQLFALGLAQVEAEKAALVRTEFMSRVSHELRTPLNAVLGFAQLLRINGLTQDRQETVRSASQIVSAGAHLLSLINDMLDLSSLDAGRLNLQLGPVALGPLVLRCLALIGPHALESGITLEARIDPLLPTVRVDARAIKQVLFNLLGNAIKFGKPQTAVRVGASRDPVLGHVTLTVTDHGLGIEADKLSAIFEPFTRIRGASDATPGSGLGLSISQKLVQAMAGRIDVASTPGVGTTFSVHLPIDGGAELLAPVESAFAAPEQRTTEPMPVKGTVLYIEDDPVNALLMQEFFKALPTRPVVLSVATTGRDGLREALLLGPDLVMLDMNLPDLDGLEILMHLKADTRTAHIPVIGVSADAMPEQIKKAMEAGLDGYWTKPVDIRKVHAEISRRFPSVD